MYIAKKIAIMALCVFGVGGAQGMFEGQTSLSEVTDPNHGRITITMPRRPESAATQDGVAPVSALEVRESSNENDTSNTAQQEEGTTSQNWLRRQRENLQDCWRRWQQRNDTPDTSLEAQLQDVSCFKRARLIRKASDLEVRRLSLSIRANCRYEFLDRCNNTQQWTTCLLGVAGGLPWLDFFVF